MKFRPYHNPENIDESEVPAGWRFRYADEAGTIAYGPCRVWYGSGFTTFEGFAGELLFYTYIVPFA